MGRAISIPFLADQLRTEADAYLFLEELRWGDQPICPHCGSVRKHYFLQPRNGESRHTRTGSESPRRVWKCADCRKQFSVLTGTIFHGTKVSLRTWLFVVFEMCHSKNGVAAKEIERKYGLHPKTAWFMAHRIREAMKGDAMVTLMSGRVTADETWVGGKPSNRHGHKRGQGGQGKTTKTPVIALVCHETGEVRAEAIADVTGDTLARVLAEQVDAANTHLQTDSSGSYTKLGEKFASHTTVDHQAGEYVGPDGTSTNTAENFFSQFKRSIDGTHHFVSRDHLNRYLAEFSFRYSTRKLTDSERMSVLMGQVHHRRLRYQQAG